jgi:hypothetical protein
VDGAATPVTTPSGSSGGRAAVTFTGTAGQAVYINSHSTSANLGAATVSLTGPSGEIIHWNGSGYLFGGNTLLPPTGLPETGTYTLYVVPNPTGYGTFNVQATSYTVNSSVVEP